MPVSDRSLHACAAVWQAKAAAAAESAAIMAPTSSRVSYLAGKADAYSECADAIGALLSPPPPQAPA